MRFWDSSAIVPLLVEQDRTLAVQQELEADPGLIVWWSTDVECVSALGRLAREGRITEPDIGMATDRLAVIATSWHEVRPAARIRTIAARLLRTHALRAGDATQLAAAIIVAEDDPRALPVITLDERLAEAARREGFPVVIPGAT